MTELTKKNNQTKHSDNRADQKQQSDKHSDNRIDQKQQPDQTH